MSKPLDLLLVRVHKQRLALQRTHAPLQTCCLPSFPLFDKYVFSIPETTKCPAYIHEIDMVPALQGA